MTLQLIGKLLEVKPTESKNKNTGKLTYGTEITVMFNGLDEQGYKKITVESINIDEDYREVLEDKIDKTVCVSYNIINTPKGTYVFPDTAMPVLVLDKNPLDYSDYKKIDSSKSAKAS